MGRREEEEEEGGDRGWLVFLSSLYFMYVLVYVCISARKRPRTELGISMVWYLWCQVTLCIPMIETWRGVAWCLLLYTPINTYVGR